MQNIFNEIPRTISCGDHEVTINRQPLNHTPNRDYKKMVSDKLIKRMIKCREDRIDSIRKCKDDIVGSIKQDLCVDGWDVDSEEVLMSEYFDYILNIFESDSLESRYNLDTLTTFDNINICPHCHSALFSYENSVVCINQCVNFKLVEDTIGYEFSLDNFLDLYKDKLNYHSCCGGKISLFQITREQLWFICSKCDSFI